MTDCLFQIIGSTVQHAVGYDKNISLSVSNCSNSLDIDTEWYLPRRRDCFKIRMKFPTLFSTQAKKELAGMQAGDLEGNRWVCLTLDTKRRQERGQIGAEINAWMAVPQPNPHRGKCD